MWYAVYRLATGELVSVGSVVADPLPEGLASKAVGEDRPDGVWNAQALQFDAAPPAPKIWDNPFDFMKEFSIAEEVRIRTAAKTDMQIEVLLARLMAAGRVRSDDEIVVIGLGYLQGVSDVEGPLLTSQRAQEILS